jgi:hypothetical protein
MSWDSHGFITLLGEEIEVIVTDECPIGFFGECKKDEREIWLRPHLSERDFKRTLIHEIGHMILYLTVHDEDGGEINEEEFCRLLEPLAGFIDLT